VTLIGCGQLTWTGGSPDQVLREIASAGYDGDPGQLSLDRPAADVVSWYGEFNLTPTPSHHAARFRDPEDEAGILADAVNIARYVRDLGCTDITMKATALESATISRDYIRTPGL
jgi:hypothetical protein